MQNDFHLSKPTKRCTIYCFPSSATSMAPKTSANQYCLSPDLSSSFYSILYMNIWFLLLQAFFFQSWHLQYASCIKLIYIFLSKIAQWAMLMYIRLTTCIDSLVIDLFYTTNYYIFNGNLMVKCIYWSKHIILKWLFIYLHWWQLLSFVWGTLNGCVRFASEVKEINEKMFVVEFWTDSGVSRTYWGEHTMARMVLEKTKWNIDCKCDK